MKNTSKQKQTGLSLQGLTNVRIAGAKRTVKLHLAGAAAAVLFLTACDVKDPVYNTAHPDHGKITLTTDWSRIGEGLEVPESYTVCIGDYTTTVSGATNTLDRHFAPGTYRMLVYNTPENIRFDGTVADALADAVAGGTYNPGWLFSYSAEVTISKDTDHAFTAVMQQQVRQLTIVVEPTGDAADRIERINGGLIGVAAKFDMENESYLSEMGVVFDFSKIAEGRDAGKWSFTARMFGFMPERPITLDLTIFYKDGNPEKQTIISDLTEALAAFNDDKRTPLTLGGRMVETPSGMGFEATIEGWEVVDPVEGDATLPVPARIGDFFYSDGSYSTELDPTKTVIGIVFQTDPARIGQAEKEALKEKGVTEPHGLVMALKNAGMTLAWGPLGKDEGLTKCATKEDCDNDISGLGNCDYIRRVRGNFDNYPAFKAADEYNTACTAPAKTTGWYLPATGQLYDLFRNLAGLADWTAAKDLGKDYYWYDQGDVPAELNAWMEAIAAADKDVFASGYSFWSSSEYSGGQARGWYMFLDGKVNCSWYDKDYISRVRPVLAF